LTFFFFMPIIEETGLEEDPMPMTAPRGRGRPRLKQKTLTPAQEEITQIRKQLHMTQDAFAEALGVITNTVSRWERGDHDVAPSIVKLARRILADQQSLREPPGFSHGEG
jgi:DNA-binding transcriptional regulator YiaG